MESRNRLLLRGAVASIIVLVFAIACIAGLQGSEAAFAVEGAPATSSAAALKEAVQNSSLTLPAPVPWPWIVFAVCTVLAAGCIAAIVVLLRRYRRMR